MGPGLGSGDAEFQTFLCIFDKLSSLLGHIADHEHAACVSVISVHDGGRIDIDDITVMDLSQFAGNAMAYFIIDRCAYAFGIALKTIWGTDAAMGMGVFPDNVINVLGGHACFDVLADLIEHTGVDHTRLTDAFNHGGTLDQPVLNHFLSSSAKLLHPLINVGRNRFSFINFSPESFVHNPPAFYFVVLPKPPVRCASASSSTVMPKGRKIPCTIPCPFSMRRVFPSRESLISLHIIWPSLSAS